MGGRTGDVDELRELHRLAVVERLDLRELLGMRFDRLGQGQHQALAAGRGQRRPRTVAERLARRTNGSIDVLFAGVRDLGDLTARSRIERRERAPVGRLETLRADQQVPGAGKELAGGGPEPVG